MDWEDRLDEWELELELSAQLDGSEWVTLEKAAAETGVSRAALRTWYRTGQIPSRLVDGPHGPQRLVPLGRGRRAGRGLAPAAQDHRAPPRPTRRSWRSSATASTSWNCAWPPWSAARPRRRQPLTRMTVFRR